MRLRDEMAGALSEMVGDAGRAPVRREQQSEMNHFIRRSGSWFRSAAKAAGRTPEEHQRTVQSEQKQLRDAGGRFVAEDGDDDTSEEKSGQGFDQGSRDERPRDTTPPSQKMSDSIRDRVGAMRGW